MRELQVQVDIREEKIREQKLVAETSRENEAKHVAIASQLRNKLVEYEAHAGNIEGACVIAVTSFVYPADDVSCMYMTCTCL